jgi:hypothetical protein
MTSGTETETRLALEADLAPEKQRDEQIDAKDAEIAKEEAEGERIAAVTAATHAEIATRKADHEGLEAHTYNALIDGDETDLVIAATSIQSSAALVDTCIRKLRHITENRLPAQRLRILTPKKERAVLVLDRAGIRGRVHASQLLLAVIPAGAIGGDLSIRSEMGARLAHEESQAGYDLEAATNAMETELATQRKIRDARSGPVSFVNPS